MMSFENSVQTQDLNESESNTPSQPQTVVRHQSRAKRPRFITANAINPKQQFTKTSRLNPPSEIPESNYQSREPNSKHECIFCSIPGSMRECEGVLLGPFRSIHKSSKRITQFFAHRNCAIWAPEVYETPQGLLERVPDALVRSRNRKCLACGEKGASLACMHNGARCCRPMHFRCALRSGGSLCEGYRTLCPFHSQFSVAFEDSIQYHERTPVSDVVLKVGNACTNCTGDSYNKSNGAILTCNNCFGRLHSRCIVPKQEFDNVLAANSFLGKHYCKKCMLCAVCERRVDLRAYDVKRRNSSLHDTDCDWPLDQDAGDECNTILCVSCGHYAVHIDCLELQSARVRWRCDLCRVCRHCNKFGISKDDWNETHEACPCCFKEIEDGAVVCPVCEKVYKEFDGVPMVQCDECDSWIHADTCGGLSTERFKQLGDDSEKYSCPLCAEKKLKKAEKRRLKAVGRKDGSSARSKGVSDALNAILDNLAPPKNETAFFSIQTGNREDGDIPVKAMTDMALQTEICRRCCSSALRTSLQFCLTCGECYHLNCIDDAPDEKNQWQCTECKRKWELDRLLAADEDTRKDAVTASEPGVSSSERSRTNRNVGRTVHWADERKCEMCGRNERIGSIEGRLIPWSSSVNGDLSDCWVHVGCLLCSPSVLRHQTSKNYDTILGPRRTLLALAKRSNCGMCDKGGAHLKCGASNCRKFYHLFCASAARVCCKITTRHEKSRKILSEREGLINIGDVDEISIFCPKHQKGKEHGSNGLLLVDALRMINLERTIYAVDSQGYLLNIDEVKPRAVSMDRTVRMRVGSLAVLRFGDLIPEVNEFIINGSLVPLGYCAIRRFWSMRKVGYRCVYFLEVGGHAQSGPKFTIRCSDDLAVRIEDKDINSAWRRVWIQAMQIQLGTDLDVNIEKCRTGLEIFGLTNCESIVRHIESLPFASMFSGRYTARWNTDATNNVVEFYDPLAKRYTAPYIRVNSTGCARSEGYRRKQDIHTEGPVFENMRTGSVFQMQVAREMLGSKDERKQRLLEHRSIDGVSHKHTKSLNGRTRRATLGDMPSIGQIEGKPFRVKKGNEVKMESIEENFALVPTAKRRTKILRSEIDGWGVFATTDFAAGELIIEYVGQIIRPPVSDVREREYLDDGMGCYMFELVPGEIVDATVRGNAARYINHSCAPNCVSRKVAVGEGREVVAIFSKRPIQRGEELSYDYQFPYDDADRVKCECGAEQCKGFMN